MALDPELRKRLIEIFKGDLDEHLQILTQSLLHLETGLEGDERQKAFDSAMRSAHSIKGASRSVGLAVIPEICHAMESLFSKLARGGNTADLPTLVSLGLESTDRIRDAMDAFDADRDPDFDHQDLITRVNSLLDLDTADSDGQDDDESEDVEAAPAKETKAEKPAKAKPEAGEKPATKKKAPEQAKKTESTAKAPPKPEPEPAPADEDEFEIFDTEDEGFEDEEQLAEEEREETLRKTASSYLRVPTERLDRIEALFEELLMVRDGYEFEAAELRKLRRLTEEIGFRDTYGGGGGRVATNGGGKALVRADARQEVGSVIEVAANVDQIMRGTTRQFGILLQSLRNEFRMLRLVPIALLFDSLPRSVRDLALNLDKQIKLHIQHRGIEIDRALLELLSDPVVHLIRNAVDHGIEMPDERKRLGKDPVGNIHVDVTREGADIILAIKDDGGGMDPKRIRDAALRKRIVTEAEVDRMSEDEILELIFRPGFSTKRIITDVSGRGVGLDVVRTNLSSLRGNLKIKSDINQGTEFLMRLPFTMTTERGLLVTAAGEQYLIPVGSIDRVIKVGVDEIETVAGDTVIMVEDRPVPLRSLAMTLGTRSDMTTDRVMTVIIISAGFRDVALVVDELTGEREIVIKPLTPPLKSVANVSGGALTGDGGVLIVLTPHELVDNALAGGSKWRGVEDINEPERPPAHILVVDDTLTTRVLEKNILEGAGYTVETAADGEEAFQILQSGNFDLVVSDVQMPRMDGFQLCENIRKDSRLGETPLVLVTSLDQREYKEKGVEVGADGYVVKGEFEAGILLDVISQLLM